MLETTCAATTLALIFQSRQASFFSLLPHIVSVTQSAVVIGSNALWLFWLGPRFFPEVTLEGKVASLIMGGGEKVGNLFGHRAAAVDDISA